MTTAMVADAPPDARVPGGGVAEEPADPVGVRRVTVVGSGVIGTSIALRLRRAGIHVGLSDRDTGALAQAVRMGAGTALTRDDPPADVVVIATPPSTVVDVLREAQARGLGAVYTDVASAKTRIIADAELAGCDFTTYVPGHPMAGRELSGPCAAHADLFTGRPWALCPHPATPAGPVRLVAQLVGVCGGELRVLTPEAHDRAAAAVSHVPHLVSAALAAWFAGADQSTLSLAGRGLQDTTRVATGAPGLWCDILQQNADPIAAVLDAVVRDLTTAAGALRSADHARGGPLADLLVRGNRGREHILGGPAGAQERTVA
ncbi:MULTISPECIES: prephenate dehydrogenase [Streptosporangium]|uniref:Prephenate dehydrogenase n=1 Tax=Streptosporangium brasiliense TaxID=47480 RepID=A0ABT9RLY3_9ACTN|nr:prephenate dehydrogenase [Streptosporangium brasiliense]MDP9870303.1 prephenate dehydrogenase [Streptosporangium brasiliense]